MDIALLILRVVCGLGIAAHGAQKAFGWWKGPGPVGTHRMMGGLGFRPPELWRAAVIACELGGGLLLAVGFLTPVGPLAVIAAMLVATLAVHLPNGFFNQDRGYELPLVGYAVPSLVVMIAGPGAYSLDGALGTALPEPGSGIVGILVVVAATFLAFAGRQPSAAVTGKVRHPSEEAVPPQPGPPASTRP